MKTLSDGFEVSSRSYYYLLDWNELNEHKFILEKFNKTRLKDLLLSEYKILFTHATQSELNNW